MKQKGKLMIQVVAILLLVITGGMKGNAQSSYVKLIKPMADQLSLAYGIPSSIIMAVAIIESGGGNSRNSKILNNHFGIKGKNNALQEHGVRTAYKQYNSVAESFADFCKLLTRKKFYETLKGNMNYKNWVQAISNAGYSTAPAQWRQKVYSAIQKYNLF